MYSGGLKRNTCKHTILESGWREGHTAMTYASRCRKTVYEMENCVLLPVTPFRPRNIKKEKRKISVGSPTYGRSFSGGGTVYI